MIYIIASVIFVFLAIIYYLINFYEENKLETFSNTYFLLDISDNTVKIGKSKNVKRRMKQIENQLHIQLQLIFLIPFDLEKNLHYIFKNEWLGKDYKKGTEWFQFSNNIKIFINK